MSENGASCQSSDIVYSMSVVANPTSLDTNFISFNSGTRTVSWSTSNSAYIGTNSVKITSKISRNSGVTSKLSSFDLVVTGQTCSESTDTFTLTAAVINDQSYVLGSSTNKTLVVPKFSGQGTWCNQNDITYTFDNSAMVFVDFDAASMTFDWGAKATQSNIG